MTKEQMEIRRQYLEEVKGPGKFEAEEAYVPYFWDMILDGCGGEEIYFGEGEPEYNMIEISEDDRGIFPELKGVFGICLWESNQGFVNSGTYSSKEDYQAELDNLEEQSAGE